MRQSFHERILDFMRAIRQRGLQQITFDDAKYAITVEFGDDRAKRSHIFNFLIKIGYFTRVNSNVLQINHEIEEKCRGDELFFLGECVSERK